MYTALSQVMLQKVKTPDLLSKESSAFQNKKNK